MQSWASQFVERSSFACLVECLIKEKGLRISFKSNEELCNGKVNSIESFFGRGPLSVYKQWGEKMQSLLNARTRKLWENLSFLWGMTSWISRSTKEKRFCNPFLPFFLLLEFIELIEWSEHSRASSLEVSAAEMFGIIKIKCKTIKINFKIIYWEPKNKSL